MYNPADPYDTREVDHVGTKLNLSDPKVIEDQWKKALPNRNTRESE